MFEQMVQTKRPTSPRASPENDIPTLLRQFELLISLGGSTPPARPSCLSKLTSRDLACDDAGHTKVINEKVPEGFHRCCVFCNIWGKERAEFNTILYQQLCCVSFYSSNRAVFNKILF